MLGMMLDILLDERFVGANATLASIDEWAVDTWPRLEMAWMLMMILVLAKVVRIDPLAVHVLGVMLKCMPHRAAPRIGWFDQGY